MSEESKAYYSKSAIAWQLLMAGLINLLSLALPIMMLQVYDRIIPHQAYGTLSLLVAGVLTALVFDACLRMMRAYAIGWFSARQENAQNINAMHRFLHGNINDYERHNTGVHLQNMMAIGRLREFYSGQAMIALIDVPFTLLFLGLIAYIAGTLVLVPIVLLGMFSILAIEYGNVLKEKLEKRHQDEDGKWNYVVAILSSIHTLKSMGCEDVALRQFENIQANMTKRSYDVAKATGATSLLSAVFGQATLIATVTVGCFFVIGGMLSVGGLSACTLLAGRTIQPVQRLLGAWLRLQDLTIAKESVKQLFSGRYLPRTIDPITLPAGEIVIQNMSYTHDGGRDSVLRHVNVSIRPGDCVALMGAKGCGKSTLLQIIAGVLTPDKGLVTVDDMIPSERSGSGLIRHIGYLPQNGTIFKGTILDNITGFRRDEQIIEKAKIGMRELGLEEVVNQLPQGYHTMLYDNASDLIPPGVKQRLCLLRVLINHPSILLFDDADRTIDKEGYNFIYRLLGKIKGKATIVLATHDENILSLTDYTYTMVSGQLRKSSSRTTGRLTLLTSAAGGN